MSVNLKQKNAMNFSDEVSKPQLLVNKESVQDLSKDNEDNSGVVKLPENETVKRRAILYNFSGHRIPQHVIEHLKSSEGGSYTQFILFSTVVRLDFSKDVERQIEDVLDEFANKTNKLGQRPFDLEGRKFIMLPGHEVAGELISSAIEALLRIPPDVLVVKYDNNYREYVLSQILRRKSWKQKWRCEKRKQYCCPQDTVIEV